MTDTDAHIQHTWHLASNTGDEITLDLWTDNYTVTIDGGPDDGDQRDGGQPDVDRLLTSYRAAGYREARDYAVNDAATSDDEPSDDEPDGPEACPECGSPVEYEPQHTSDWREGAAWLCTGCRWGQYVTA